MKNLARWSSIAAASVFAAITVAPAFAQKAGKADTPSRPVAQSPSLIRCAPDTKALWYRTQVDFYAQDSKHDWSNDTLRTRLLEAVHWTADSTPMVFGSEALRGGTTPQWAATSVSPDARELLLGLAKQRQWPTRSLVGAAGVHAALVIAQRDS